jgi:hypothetical protein
MPNPVLACSEDVLSGTEMRVEGSAAGILTSPSLVEIRVSSPKGPVMSSENLLVSERTGDWVRNGMDFFLMHSGVALASDRAYVLPARVCSAGGTATLRHRNSLDASTRKAAWSTSFRQARRQFRSQPTKAERGPPSQVKVSRHFSLADKVAAERALPLQ